MKKMLILIIAFFIISIFYSANCLANDGDNIKVVLDGQQLQFDANPVLLHDRVMLPVRNIFEALGATVDWNEATQTITGIKGDTTIILKVNSTDAIVNGKHQTIDFPATIIDNRTLVPARFISENLETIVDWDETTKTVYITSKLIIKTINYNSILQKENYSINSRINIQGIDLDANAYLLDFQKDDVTGDKISDNILLLGKHLDNFSFTYYDNISIVIQDGKSKNLTIIKPEYGRGYSYSIYLGDFTGDKINDILFSINNDMVGGAGQFSFGIYSFTGDNLINLFDNKKVYDSICPKVDFMDDFRVKVYSPALNKSFEIDVSDKKDSYNELGLYVDSKLKELTAGSADNYCELSPEDIDNDGVFELRGTQYVSGFGHSDGIGMVSSILKWSRDKQEWEIKDLSFEKFK